ncbi:MAG: 50S ribosomal protein L25 [Deltaproteobacteria bacterium]|nr:50S ribosomal protein L25 [Deltaproteobacteria bacterium]MBW2017506.1 50S ribosomal protein L25 [Deltaproteobacteria bacterium]MBW2129760.1 50S ribosomal protein L25 [Deltaproteobacteria bacterium]MBW2302475.1 50S ribosomal protein L25 [Deltaproteobacteria bacterium]
MAQLTLAARIRDTKGKEAAKKLRKNQQVPAVFYGPGREPVMLAVRYMDLQKLIKRGSLENTVLGLEIQSNGGSEKYNVMVKEIQMDPLKDTCYHVDFYEIAMDKEITLDVPIHLVQTPVGVAKGGVLQHVRREITISTLPGKLVDAIEVDVSGLDIGETLHVGDIKLPEGITTPLEGHLAVAVVQAPVAEPGRAEEEEGAAEEEAEGVDTESEQQE